MKSYKRKVNPPTETTDGFVFLGLKNSFSPIEKELFLLSHRDNIKNNSGRINKDGQIE